MLGLEWFGVARSAADSVQFATFHRTFHLSRLGHQLGRFTFQEATGTIDCRKEPRTERQAWNFGQPFQEVEGLPPRGRPGLGR